MLPHEKAAVLLILMGPEVAGRIVQGLPPNLARKILQTIASQRKFEEKEAEPIVKEFLAHLKHSGQHKNHSQNVNSVEKFIKGIQQNVKDDSWFDSLRMSSTVQDLRDEIDTIENGHLTKWLVKERLQVIAFALSLLHPKKAAQILKELPESIQSPVLECVSRGLNVDGEILEIFQSELGNLKKAQTFVGAQLGGVKKLVGLVQSLEGPIRNKLLMQIKERDDKLGQEITNQMLSIDRIVTLLPQHMAKVCAQLKDRELALLSKQEKSEISEVFFNCVSKNRRAQIEEQLSSISKVRVQEIESCYARLVSIVIKLKDDGEIFFPWEEKLVM